MDRAFRQDLIVALLLALALGIGWTVADWTALSSLRLPDTDDVMRLQQVRDWLGGQRFADLVQHRLGDGVPMHWTRLADLAPAVLILVLQPVLGSHAAQVAAVVTAPLLLFVAALVLVARVARSVGSEPATATVVAAIAYPATTIFLPGRIDHHGLQVVLLLGATLAAVGRPTLRRGAWIGGLVAASLVVGLETAPLLGVILLFLAVEATLARRGGEARLSGAAVALLAGALVARATFAPDMFRYPACDGFTAEAWRATLIGGAALFLLAVALSTVARSPTARIVAALCVGMSAALGLVVASPGCLHPYGNVPPVLARWWLGRVAEAQPLTAAPAAIAIGYAGLTIVGLLATAWRLRSARTRAWLLLLAVQFAAVSVTLSQLRGAYAGAILGAPALAALIVAARRRGVPALVAAWVASAGLLYPFVADALVPADRSRGGRAGMDCTAPAVLDMVRRLPPGMLLTTIDSGPLAIAQTSQRVLAGPYHRDVDGNLAMLRMFAAPPEVAWRMIHARHVDYVLLCDADARVLPRGGASLADAIVAGVHPAWLRPLPVPDRSVHLYAVRDARR